MLKSLVIPLIVLAIVGGAVAYIIRAKKRGHTCIGCPYADTCAGRACACSQSIDAQTSTDK